MEAGCLAMESRRIVMGFRPGMIVLAPGLMCFLIMGVGGVVMGIRRIIVIAVLRMTHRLHGRTTGAFMGNAGLSGGMRGGLGFLIRGVEY
jgi:hypothetical protein